MKNRRTIDEARIFLTTTSNVILARVVICSPPSATVFESVLNTKCVVSAALLRAGIPRNARVKMGEHDDKER